MVPEQPETPKLIQPRSHKAKVLIWADLTVNEMDLLDEAVSPDNIKDELARIFNLEDHKENLKAGVLLDLYYYTIRFTRDLNFSKEQTSAFFSIVKRTHEVCTETPFGNVEQCFSYFRELMLCHAIKRPPFSLDLFNAEDVRKITEYVINTYFRHYKMYKYVFTPLVRLDLSMAYSGMPQTPEPSEAGDQEEGKLEDEGDGTEGEVKGQEQEEENADTAEQNQETVEVTAQFDCAEVDVVDQDDQPSAAKELRSLIKQHLSEEMKKLKISVEEQIKNSEDTINRKLVAVEGGQSSKRGSSRAGKKH